MVEFALDLISQGYPLNVFVNDTSINTAGFWVNDNVKYFTTPKVQDDENKYIDLLLENCIKYEINIIIPLMDFELPILASNKKTFNNNNIEVIVSEYDTIVNCINKRKNYSFCNNHDIKMPRTIFSKNHDILEYPVILKRIFGSGSVGQKIIYNKKELGVFKKDQDLLQEYISGKEYGMDIFNDLDGNYIHSLTREKLLMRNGETDKAKVVNSNKFVDLATKISKEFSHIGNMDIDFIEDMNGDLFVIDFNPRFGGGYPLTHICGYNYLKALLDIIIGNPLNFPNKVRDVVLMKGISIQYHKS